VPTREQIRDALSGNYCRCTGYEAIVDAIEKVARDRDAGGIAQASEEVGA
jgi:carbon-monoxide dehydrogenase small subunit